MRIGFISGHACIRAQKIALGLISKGHKIHFISSKLPNYSEYYESTLLYSSIEQLKQSIKLVDKDIDVWHVHNEPSYYVSIVKELSSKSVVLDIHDSYAARLTEEEEIELIQKGEKTMRITSDELHNFQLADALVYPSESFGEIVTQTYGLEDKKRILLPSYVPSTFFNYEATKWMGGIVYEGRIDLPSEYNKAGRQGYNYTDYIEFANECYDKKLDFYIYSTRNDKEFRDSYEKALLAGSLKFDNLIKALSGHAWGIVGNTNKATEWSIALPNKMFEYIAAGTPIVSFYADECSRWLEKYGIGITCKCVEELKDRFIEHEECRRNLIKLRSKFAMENNLEELEGVYNEIK